MVKRNNKNVFTIRFDCRFHHISIINIIICIYWLCYFQIYYKYILYIYYIYIIQTYFKELLSRDSINSLGNKAKKINSLFSKYKNMLIGCAKL